MPRRALDVEQPRGERGAGRAAGDERVGAPVRHGADGLHDRRVGRGAHGARGIGRLGDRDRRVDDLDARAPARSRRPARTRSRAGRRPRPRARRRARPRPDRRRRRWRRARSSAAARQRPWPPGPSARGRDRGRARARPRARRTTPQLRADPVRAARLVALRAQVDRGRGDLVRRAALVRARVRLLLLGDGHGRRRRVANSAQHQRNTWARTRGTECSWCRHTTRTATGSGRNRVVRRCCR